ncbi:MAG: Cell division protein DivIC (FtsB), stabilizes FtsL against RasP cleavage [Acidobacteriaceae bacterium]|nr:Cell division protein DivIC (FtsB), stabilizes FtsL against RasP cleavage [Acidobacteriaceae bacterium]
MNRLATPASGSQPPQSPRGRLARRFTVATAAYTQRRRVATVFAVVVAALVGYHSFFGANGLLAYRAKRDEDRILSRQLEQMKLENSRLKAHVEHLKNDPDAIEYEAHTRLRYTRPDQVIVLNNAGDSTTQTSVSGPKSTRTPR